MNIIDEIGDIYNHLDNIYSTIVHQAISKRWYNKVEKYRKKRALNDQAHFLFMFTRLEDKIKSVATEIINHKSNSKNYQNGRAWQMLKQRNDRNRLDLMERASLLIEYNGRDYHLLLGYKRTRDNIAHGGSEVINMVDAIDNLSRLYNSF